MNEIDRKRLLELLNSIKPEVIYCNPSDRAIIDEALEETKTTHIFEVRENAVIKKGNIFRVDKKELNVYTHTPPININLDPDSASCNNCKHQPGILQMCDYGKSRTSIMMKCPRWEKR